MESAIEKKMNVENLYIEATVTDFESGVIKQFTPIGVGGIPDLTRDSKFVVVTTIMTPQGPFTVQAEMGDEVTTLAEAVIGFAEAIDTKIGEMVEEATLAAEEEQTRIITPGEVTAAGPNLSIVK